MAGAELTVIADRPALRPPATRIRLRAGTLLIALALTTVAIVSRLPQLRSPNLLVDGDECVLGLMAKHVAQGKEFPIFFYGQNYAFSPVEETAGAIAFRSFGTSPIALKSAALALWIAGVLFGFAALSNVIGAWRAFWIAALLILNPMWAAWSMKAGGGYLTSFAAVSILFWLLSRDASGDSIAAWLAAGALAGIVYLAQPLWLPGALPLVAAMLLGRRRRVSLAIVFAAAAVVVVFWVKMAAPFVPDGWKGPAVGNTNLLGSIGSVASQVYVFMTGAYYLAWATDPPGPVTTTLAWIWCGLLAGSALLQLYRIGTRRYCVLSHLLFASIAATLIAEWVLLAARDARYLLPLGGLLVTLIGVELFDLVDRKLLPKIAAAGLLSALLFLGAVSMWEFREFNYLWRNPPQRWSETRRLQQVLNYLKVMDAKRVFSINGLLDTQLIFYSDEQVLSRWTNPSGRYHPYVVEVNRALAAGEKVAVVGYTNNSGAPGCWDVPICTGGIETLVPNPSSIFVVDDKYFVYVGADRALLTRLGFRFWD